MLCINCYQWIFVSIMFNNTDRLFNLKSMVRRALGFTVLRYFGNFTYWLFVRDLYIDFYLLFIRDSD